MLRTSLCDLLGIEYPIIQGGMAHLGTAELVSAVSNAGGLGVIGSAAASPGWLTKQIHLTRDRTDKPFAVNIVLLAPFLEENLEVALKERVGIVIFGGGNPSAYIHKLKEAGVKVISVISSVALARRLERFGVDGIIAEGMEAGGHIGEVTTMALVPQVADGVRLPVVAAGGIADGRGMAAALALGAQGVQMGTRFICSEECIAHLGFKERILKAHDRATVVTGGTTGHPVRCLENKVTRQFIALERDGVAKEVLEEFGMGRLYLGVIEGNMDEGSLMAGQIAGLIRGIKPAKAIVEDIVAEAEEVINKLEEVVHG